MEATSGKVVTLLYGFHTSSRTTSSFGFASFSVAGTAAGFPPPAGFEFPATLSTFPFFFFEGWVEAAAAGGGTFERYT